MAMDRRITIQITDELTIPSDLQIPGSRVALVLDGASVDTYSALFQSPSPNARASKRNNYQTLVLTVQSVTIEEATPIVQVATLPEEPTEEPAASSEPEVVDENDPALMV